MKGFRFRCRRVVGENLNFNTDIAERVIADATKMGAKYADVRLESSKWESIVVKDGKVESVKSGEQYGMGLRVLLKTWGFASTTDIGKSALKEAVESAVGMARSAKKVGKITLSKSAVEEAIVRTKIIINPLDVPIEEKVKLCLDSDAGPVGCTGAVAQRHGRHIQENPGDTAFFGVFQHALLSAA